MSTLRKLRFMFLGVLLVAILIVAGVGAQDSAPACEGDYLESVRELGLIYVNSINAGDLDPWYEVLTDDYMAYYPDVGFEPMDRDAARTADEALMATFPGFQTEVHLSTVSSDCHYVTFHWTSRGNFDGAMGEIPPNGNPIEVSGISLIEVADGKIVSERVSYDLLSLLTQMGLMGGPAES
jgi:predicted ester cyclase